MKSISRRNIILNGLIFLAMPSISYAEPRRCASVSELRRVTPRFINDVVYVKEYEHGFNIGGGDFIAIPKKYHSDDGGKYIDGGSIDYIWKRKEYVEGYIVFPHWYGCRGVGRRSPDSIPFQRMLKNLSDGEIVDLGKNKSFHNDYPGSSKDCHWMITAHNVTIRGDNVILSRRRSDSSSFKNDYGLTCLFVKGVNGFHLTGKLFLESDDLKGTCLYKKGGKDILVKNNNYVTSNTVTFNIHLENSRNIIIDKDITLRNAIFNGYANGCNNIQINGLCISSGQRLGVKDDEGLGSSWKINKCKNITANIVSMHSAFAGLEMESHNSNGNLTCKTYGAYHAGIHFYNNNKNFNYNSYCENSFLNGAIYISRDASNINGYAYAKNCNTLADFIGFPGARVTGCSVQGVGENIKNAAITLYSKGGGEDVVNCDVDTEILKSNISNDRVVPCVIVNGAMKNTIKIKSVGYSLAIKAVKGAGNIINIKMKGKLLNNFSNKMFSLNNKLNIYE